MTGKLSDAEKTRREYSLETLDSVLSAVVIAKKWMGYYPVPPRSALEEQSMKELSIHLWKAESVLRNLMDTFAHG